MNTLAQAEVRKNRLKNNTTRLSRAPDQAICNCCHKCKLAGYPPERVNRHCGVVVDRCTAGTSDTKELKEVPYCSWIAVMAGCRMAHRILNLHVVGDIDADANHALGNIVHHHTACINPAD